MVALLEHEDAQAEARLRRREWFRAYRARRRAEGRAIKRWRQPPFVEAPGLKPPLTGEYCKCGFPDPNLELISKEVSEACVGFWRRRNMREPIAGNAISWDWAIQWANRI